MVNLCFFIFLCLPDFQEQPDSVAEVGEDAVTSVGAAPLPPVMTEEERQELQQELAKVWREQGLMSDVSLKSVRIQNFHHCLLLYMTVFCFSNHFSL